ncbi:MAG: hypothetical protein MRY64_11145 [Hyphomonadaceae bacterium]|nr:hypothetical protein [Hyphomonadaceae bacterium]
MVQCEKLIRLSLGPALLCALSACGTMNVEVDVLDPEYFQAEQQRIERARIVQRILLTVPGSVDRDAHVLCSALIDGVNRIDERNFESLNAFASCFAAQGPGAECPQSGQDLRDKMSGDLQGSQLATELEQLRREVLSSADSAPWSLSDCTPEDVNRPELQAAYTALMDSALAFEKAEAGSAEANEAWVKLRESRNQYDFLLSRTKLQILNALEEEATLLEIPDISFFPVVSLTSTETQSAITTAMDDLEESRKADVEEVIDDIEHDVDEGTSTRQAQSTGLLGDRGVSLIDSDLAFAALNAPDDAWRKQFNEAKGFGIGGSTDVVVVLNSTADFSVKGLIFDNRAAATATRKLTISALSILASGAVPAINFPEANTEDRQSEPGVSYDAILNSTRSAENEVALNEGELESRNAALRTIAFSVLQSAQIAEAETSETSQALSRARDLATSVFEAQSALIYSSEQSGGTD